MSITSSLRDYFAEHARRFSATLPGIRDGDVDAVHDARVAVRRMRAVLPLLSISAGHEPERWAHGLRALGRALGRARDIDVSIGLLTRYEQRIPPVGPLALTLRQSLEAHRWPSLRRLIKQLDASEIRTLLREFKRFGQGSRSHRPWISRSTTERLRAHMAEHASALAGAIDHAAGVYFPNRVHQVRIEAKKLRYVLEIAASVEMWPADREVATLTRAQELLGDIHDRQVLLDLLDAHVDGPASLRDRDAFASILAVERDGFHRRYVERRGEILHVCAATQRFGPRATGLRPRLGRAVAYGAMALPVAVWLILRRRNSSQSA